MARNIQSETEPPTQAPPQQRGKACRTCKIRRVKCTYERPTCSRCIRTGRKCDGYAAPKLLKHEDRPVALLLVVDRAVPSLCDHVALTSFQLFREVCAPALQNYGSHRFWNELVLQACYVDESIKHLTIAASRLGKCHLREPGYDVSAEKDAVFLSHYGKALKVLGQARDIDPACLLMACLLLILCEDVQNNPFAALQHQIAGRKILASYRPRTSSQCSFAIDQLSLIFTKLERQTSEIYSRVRPLDDVQHITTEPTETWPSVDEAAVELQAIAFEATSRHFPGLPPKTRFHTVPEVTTKLNAWIDRYVDYESNTTHKPYPYPRNVPNIQDAQRTSLYVLRTYHICVCILSRCVPFSQETAFDAYAGNFEHIMVACGFMVRENVKARLLPILFFVATRYRDASFRRRAVEMLKLCGIDGGLLARLAMKVVRIEEAGLRDLIVCADVPEEHRIRVVDLVFDAQATSYILRYVRKPYGDDALVKTASIQAAALPWDPEPQKPCYTAQLLKSILKFDFMTFWNQDDPAFTVPDTICPT